MKISSCCSIASVLQAPPLKTGIRDQPHLGEGGGGAGFPSSPGPPTHEAPNHVPEGHRDLSASGPGILGAWAPLPQSHRIATAQECHLHFYQAKCQLKPHPAPAWKTLAWGDDKPLATINKTTLIVSHVWLPGCVMAHPGNYFHIAAGEAVWGMVMSWCPFGKDGPEIPVGWDG